MADKRVMIAMSGGVDSSVAAYLLKERGYDAAAVTMCLGINNVSGGYSGCCSPQDIHDAKSVCRKIGIPHYVFDFSDELKRYVLENFILQYKQGRTPNPCVRCNQYLKFDILLRRAKVLGFDYLATGHYGRIIEREGEHFLVRPGDIQKDQTYFLYPIKKEHLSEILFPLSSLNKDEVKQIAASQNLEVERKRESQDLCFTHSDYREFLYEYRNEGAAGEIVDLQGNYLNEHSCIENYTIGQRKGLGIAAGKPLYVIDIDAENRKVVVGPKTALYSNGFIIKEYNWLREQIGGRYTVKTRYRKKEVPAVVEKDNEELRVMFDKKQEGGTPGQSAVFYDNDVVAGGGVIEKKL